MVPRLFLPADDTGIYADRDIYGNGRMDLGAATSPVGVLDVPHLAHQVVRGPRLESRHGVLRFRASAWAPGGGDVDEADVREAVADKLERDF